MSRSRFAEKQLAACPNKAQHVKDGAALYVEWHSWAEYKSKTHDQEQCPGCGLYVIWKPKRKVSSG